MRSPNPTLLRVGAATLGIVIAACGGSRDTLADGRIDPDDGSIDDGSQGDGQTGDDAGITPDGGTQAATCEPHHWQPALPAGGTAVMAFRGKAYLFASNGLVWTVIEDNVGLTGSIPLPAGVTSMQAVVAEIAPNGLPLVSFYSENLQYATFFDGTQFTPLVSVARGSTIHGDAAGRIYEVGSTGLVEHPPGAPPIFRGALPFMPLAWTIGADGTVRILRRTTTMTSLSDHLKMTSLPHGSLTWSSEVLVTSNAVGFSRVLFTAAADGSLHLAYHPVGIYLRSMDGATWDQQQFTHFSVNATMIDPAAGNPNFNDQPWKVGGSLSLLAAQDYDHASITLVNHTGSFGTPSLYFLRRCPPFVGTGNAWPADRFGFSGLAGDNGRLAVNERGLASILTPTGMRKDVTGP